MDSYDHGHNIPEELDHISIIIVIFSVTIDITVAVLVMVVGFTTTYAISAYQSFTNKTDCHNITEILLSE